MKTLKDWIYLNTPSKDTVFRIRQVRGCIDLVSAASKADYPSLFEETIGKEKVFVVLALNEKCGYIGIEVFQKSGELIQDGFFQNATEELRPDIFDLTEINIAKTCLSFLAEL